MLIDFHSNQLEIFTWSIQQRENLKQNKTQATKDCNTL